MTDIKREDIIAAFDLKSVMESYGVKLKKSGTREKCLCPFHNEKTPSLVYYDKDKSWHCYGCGKHGTVIDWVAHSQFQGDGKRAYKALADRLSERTQNATQPEQEKSQPMKLVATYDYVDATGKTVFKVDRKEADGKKTFLQYQIVNGKPKYTMDGVARVLYRMPKVANSSQVFICEGEKCVHALEDCGYVATTNAGGCRGWLAGYAQSLENKEAIIMPDNDEPGEGWLKAVSDSLSGVAKSVRVIRMPEGINDIADMVDADGASATRDWIDSQFDETAAIQRGIDLPILSSEEMEQRYFDYISRGKEGLINIGDFSSNLGRIVRPLMPGDLVTIMADTGVGKTAIARNIARAIRPATCLFFEIELTAELMAERDLAMTNWRDAMMVEHDYRSGERYKIENMNHVFTCVESKVTPEFLQSTIQRSELKTGAKPQAVFVDYIGLISGGFGKRYERMSTIAEELKVIAKLTNVVMFITSQVHRDTSDEIGLHDAKDSGSIENSSALVLGAWRPANNKLCIRVLKQTRGKAGLHTCHYYEGAQSYIRDWDDDNDKESHMEDEKDLPKGIHR